MPAKTKAQQNTWNKQRSFVRYDLDEKERHLCKQWLDGTADVDEPLREFLGLGYRISVSYDPNHTCFSAFATVDDVANKNNTLVLPGRGSTALKAIKQVLFKHYELFAGKWPPSDDPLANQPIDD